MRTYTCSCGQRLPEPMFFVLREDEVTGDRFGVKVTRCARCRQIIIFDTGVSAGELPADFFDICNDWYDKGDKLCPTKSPSWE